MEVWVGLMVAWQDTMGGASIEDARMHIINHAPVHQHASAHQLHHHITAHIYTNAYMHARITLRRVSQWCKLSLMQMDSWLIFICSMG